MRVASSAGSVLAAMVALAVGACGDAGDGAPGPEPTVFTVEFGTWDADARVFAPLADGAPVDVVMGFQGLVFVNLALRAERNIAARFVARGEVVFEDYDERYPFYDNQVLFEPVGDAWRVVPSFRVPFGLPASELAGRPVRLDLVLTSHDGAWAAEGTFRFVLVDSRCVHTPEGEFVCED